MYTKEQLALALRVLNNECRSHRVCNKCPLYLAEYGRCTIEILDRDDLNDEIIDEVEKGN